MFCRSCIEILILKTTVLNSMQFQKFCLQFFSVTAAAAAFNLLKKSDLKQYIHVFIIFLSYFLLGRGLARNVGKYKCGKVEM